MRPILFDFMQTLRFSWKNHKLRSCLTRKNIPSRP